MSVPFLLVHSKEFEEVRFAGPIEFLSGSPKKKTGKVS